MTLITSEIIFLYENIVKCVALTLICTEICLAICKKIKMSLYNTCIYNI